MLQVARWEYVEKIKSKAFIISLFLTPLLMIGMGVLPTLLASRPDTDGKIIGIIDQSGGMIKSLQERLNERYTLPDGNPNYVLRQISGTPTDDLMFLKKYADGLIAGEDIEGYLIIGKSILNDSSFEYRSRHVGDFKLASRLEKAIQDIIVEKKLSAHGLAASYVKELTSSIQMRTIKVSKSGQEEEAGFEKVFLTSYVFMMMMFFLIITSGQLLVRSMLEEKTNRVVEVLMSSSSANDLMGGKILGLSALGLTQIGLWAVIGIIISLKFTITMIPIGGAFVLLLYFIIGYVMYAAIFVAAGAPVSTEMEAQQIFGYLVMILIIPMVMTIMIIREPNSVIATVFSYIPLLTPLMMAIRIPLQMPPLIEIVTSLLLLTVCAIGAVWVAGKIFRTTILSYGKRPSLIELWKFVKSA
jgi:ABC-2 type transport system permease protein